MVNKIKIQSKKTSDENLGWSEEFKQFLKEWFSGLITGIERLNDSTWPKVLELTGRACAHVHSDALFGETWKNTQNLDDFIIKINESYRKKVFKRIDEDTIEACYSKCTCPLVEHGLVDSPLLCNCSPNWLAENFESILKKSVTITTKNTILRGAKSCNFIISIETE
ncbi:MAG: hypothetical protein ACFFC6_10910 [Promethearchaeota archaeon]